ncbi:uncharacterized protein BJX67DRAFT_379037 [Aspergillus lucknowensis]|uniref:Ankyrin repeat protein n=1 Tax=Aspergillus lucknowensis TaxID=176173 RepID=A0ABR4LY87_9EURO
MAEVFGIVAGGFSAAALLDQIIKSIENLRTLRSFVKNAPTELEGLIEEAEIVQGVLKTLNPDALGSLNTPAAERRLRAFQQDLEMTISEIQQYRISSTSRKLGAVRLAWKKEAVHARRQNLDNVKSTLLLLQQAYFGASIRELSAFVYSHGISASAKRIDEHSLDDESGQLVSTKPQNTFPNRQGQSKPNEHKYRIRIPFLGFDKVLSFQSTSVYSSWGITIQTYNIIPDCSPVFKYCMEGNINAVQELFTSGAASPFDTDRHGTSLLSIAALNCQLDLCLMLLDQGADPAHKNDMGCDPLYYTNHTAQDWERNLDEVPILLDLYRLFVSATENDDSLFKTPPDGSVVPTGFTGPPEALTLIQEHVFPDYKSLPLSIRFERAMRLYPNSDLGTGPAILRITMGGCIEPAAYQMADKFGRTLLHKISQFIGIDFAMKRTSAIHGWRPFLSDAIAASADGLNKIGGANTPLTAFLTYYFMTDWFDLKQVWKCDFNPALRTWASELKAAGTDLEAYGARERALHKSGAVRLNFVVQFNYDLSKRPRHAPETDNWAWFHLVGFEYGPEPEDWKLWITNPFDEFAGEFWAMVERKEEIMPGTWME